MPDKDKEKEHNKRLGEEKGKPARLVGVQAETFFL